MTTRWYPDTCGCVFDVADDWKSATVVTKCTRHAPAGNDLAVFAAAWMHPTTKAAGDNVRKNQALDAIATADPTIGTQWSFAGDGTLNILTSKAVTAPVKTSLLANFGKVTVAVSAAVPAASLS